MMPSPMNPMRAGLTARPDVLPWAVPGVLPREAEMASSLLKPSSAGSGDSPGQLQRPGWAQRGQRACSRTPARTSCTRSAPPQPTPNRPSRHSHSSRGHRRAARSPACLWPSGAAPARRPLEVAELGTATRCHHDDHMAWLQRADTKTPGRPLRGAQPRWLAGSLARINVAHSRQAALREPPRAHARWIPLA